MKILLKRETTLFVLFLLFLYSPLSAYVLNDRDSMSLSLEFLNTHFIMDIIIFAGFICYFTVIGILYYRKAKKKKMIAIYTLIYISISLVTGFLLLHGTYNPEEPIITRERGKGIFNLAINDQTFVATMKNGVRYGGWLEGNYNERLIKSFIRKETIRG